MCGGMYKGVQGGHEHVEVRGNMYKGLWMSV